MQARMKFSRADLCLENPLTTSVPGLTTGALSMILSRERTEYMDSYSPLADSEVR